MRALFKKLRENRRGTMAIETAIVAPVLIIMSLGVFETGKIVARQHELQSSANEAAMIVLTANMGPEVELAEMKSIIRDSVDLTDTQITLTREYRCNTATGRIKIKGNCVVGSSVSEYVVVKVTDSYTPTWTAFGIGKAISFSVDRSVQVGSEVTAL